MLQLQKHGGSTALMGSIELLIVLNDDTNKVTKTVPIIT